MGIHSTKFDGGEKFINSVSLQKVVNNVSVVCAVADFYAVHCPAKGEKK
jgi:hypothetical protein